MLKWLHGLIEGFALRVYRGGVHELKAESAIWEQIEYLVIRQFCPDCLKRWISFFQMPQDLPKSFDRA